MNPINLILAQQQSVDWFKIVVGLFFAAVFVIGHIVNFIRKSQAQNKARQQLSFTDLEGEPSGGMSSQARLDDLAARRLAEMQQKQVGVSVRPDDIRDAQRAQRAQTRERFEKRAMELRRQRELAEAQRRSAEQFETKRRAQAEAQARAQTQARSRAQQQAQAKVQQAQQARSAARAQQQAGFPIAQPVQDRDPAARVAVPATGQQQPQPAGTQQSSPAIRGAARFAKLNIRSLRDAFILKEILDKPVSLREP